MRSGCCSLRALAPTRFADTAATVLLGVAIKHSNIEIGDWTYYNDGSMLEDYAGAIAPYLYEGAREKLIIGRFCQIAQGVQFVTSTANHPMGGASTYPFAMFDLPRIGHYMTQLDPAKDTVVGNDCWIGREAVIMPGATLGNGVIVGARSVVTGKVPDYAIVAGNPAKIIRMRYDGPTTKRLQQVAWWAWSKKKIELAIPAIEVGDIDALENMT
jgi:virginiamycin A acetyltransferase